MRIVSCCLIIFLLSCNKDPAQPKPALYDSIKLPFAAAYNVDIDADGTKDLRLGWNTAPGPTAITIFYVKRLRTELSIHALLQTWPVCSDSLTSSGFTNVNTHNCTGGAHQIRIDSVVGPPNLSFSSLAATSVITFPGDSLVMHRTVQSFDMPSPLYQTQLIDEGFFSASSSGYLLCGLNGKRYALFIRKSSPLSIDSSIVVN